jgi:hypothetical protein
VQQPTDVAHVGTVLPLGAIGDRGIFTCHDGRHVVDHAGDVTYVLVAVRLSDMHGTCVYPVGTAPDDVTCGMVWSYLEARATQARCRLASDGPLPSERVGARPLQLWEGDLWPLPDPRMSV